MKINALTKLRIFQQDPENMVIFLMVSKICDLVIS